MVRASPGVTAPCHRAGAPGSGRRAAMIASGAGLRADELARELFSVATHFCLALPRGRRHAGDLKDIEFLTLTILNGHGTMIVGDIQRLLGVLPAQMSRII